MHAVRMMPVTALRLTSGKDSMKNDFKADGVKISVPPTVLYSMTAKIEDVRRTITSDFKQADDVVYLLGGNDTNALHPALDKSCEGEAQGVHRYARLRNFIGYMKAREPQRLAHRWGVAPDAGHSAGQVYNSACGKAALFDAPGCTLNAASGALPAMIP